MGKYSEIAKGLGVSEAGFKFFAESIAGDIIRDGGASHYCEGDSSLRQEMLDAYMPKTVQKVQEMQVTLLHTRAHDVGKDFKSLVFNLAKETV